MELAKLFLSSVSKRQIWPLSEMEVLSWAPIKPCDMPREAPTFYFNSAGLRKAAAQVFSTRPDLVAGAKFEQVCHALKDYLKVILWPREYKTIRIRHDTLLDCYASNTDYERLTADIEDHLARSFDFKLYLMPIVCRGLAEQPLRPIAMPSDKLASAWIGDESGLRHFLGERYSTNAQLDLRNFPPEPSGKRILQDHDSDLPPTWLATLARHEEAAIINLMTLFGAITLAIGPDHPPNQTKARFGGLSYTSRGSHGFGATWRIQFPLVRGNASVRSEYQYAHYPSIVDDNAWETDFALDMIDKISGLAETKHGHRIKLACYFIGMAYLADSVSAFPFHASALDALFGFASRDLGTSVKKGLEAYCGHDPYAKKKLELFLKIRGSLAHGKRRYPEESGSYTDFLKKYDEEPLIAIWRTTRHVILQVISDLDGYERLLIEIEKNPKSRKPCTCVIDH